MSQGTAPSGHKPCLREYGPLELTELGWCSRRIQQPLQELRRSAQSRMEKRYSTSPCPTPPQREVCTRPVKAGMQRKQCQGSPFLGYRREDPVPVGRRDSLANIRSRVNPRSFRQRKDPVLGCTGVLGRTVHTCISALSACPPESEPFRDT